MCKTYASIFGKRGLQFVKILWKQKKTMILDDIC